MNTSNDWHTNKRKEVSMYSLKKITKIYLKPNNTKKEENNYP